MHGGNCLNVFAWSVVSKTRAELAQYRLIEENETRLFGLSRLDQSFLKVPDDAVFKGLEE